MPDPKDQEAVRHELLQELERLESEQRTLDLRNARAVAEHERKLVVLRERINRLGFGQ